MNARVFRDKRSSVPLNLCSEVHALYCMKQSQELWPTTTSAVDGLMK
ncbi:hypothetical protein L915_20615 [Phytophthora nicotianae]|uniref:Uncharacterized protein n=1 Tax=Phytophthora nicotianae TaxID=4792 RepID=W2HWZ3_PHYNI|nr:hypothetical protein L915_20615 [Phytophthora nicotianae]ETL25717.1 hypothetical protein L916_20475 [Phytophthora nicotianae]